MTTAEITLIVLAVLAVIAGLLMWHAQRLDRLHRRILRSRAILETQLVRRAETATDLVLEGVLDEASAVVVADAAWRAAIHADRLLGTDPADAAESLGSQAAAEISGGGDRGQAESDLTVALRAALGTSDDRQELAATDDGAILAHLERICYRVQLARRFHNEAVIAVQRLRRTWFVRAFHLAGRAPLPYPVDMDDAVFGHTPPS